MDKLKELGKPFWIALTAFFANLLVLTGLDKLDEGWVDRFWGSLLASLLVGLFIFSREQAARFREKNGSEPE
jgi:hypothetical protein